MSPRSSTLLALIAVLLAGIPLPALTGARRGSAAEEQAAPPPAAAPGRTAWISLCCSGSPTELRLLHEGRELACLSAEELAEGWGEEYELPADRPLALELHARWAAADARQAVTLCVDCDGQPTRQDTQWTEPGSDTLHGISVFSW